MSSISGKIQFSSLNESTDEQFEVEFCGEFQVVEDSEVNSISTEQQLMSKDAEISRMNMLVEQMKKESEKMKEEYERKMFEQARRFEEKESALSARVQEMTMQTMIMMRDISEATQSLAEIRADNDHDTLDATLRSLKRKDDELLEERRMAQDLRVEVQQKTRELEQKQRKLALLERKIDFMGMEKAMDGDEKGCSRANETSQLYAKRIEWYENRLEQVEKENEEMRAAQQVPRRSIPMCQICRFEFNESPDRTPRILG